MIRKTPKGYVVKSHITGRKLSKPYKTKKAAVKRLRQVKYYSKIK
jgi:hypothetical protein